METFSHIEIEFTEDLVTGNTVSFGFTDGVSVMPVTETWASVRFQSGRVPISDPTGIPGEATAINFVNAFNADHNVTGMFEVERTGNVVAIRSGTYGIDFINMEMPPSVLVSTGTGIEPFEITNVTFSSSGDCGTILVNVHTSQIADEILEPVNEPVSSNPITFENERGVSVEVAVRKGSVVRTLVVGMPSNTFPSSIDLDITDVPGGSSVKINVYRPFLNFTYSLNGTDYQQSNVFSGLLGGEYNAYVKDQYGCVVSKSFTLDSYGINSAFFRLPSANSIRFANRVVWGDCGNYKNDANTLSCESNVPLPYKEIQQFQSCDVITTQFKSNYTIHEMTVGGTKNVVNKRTSFMRRKDRRDAVLCNLGDGSSRTGIYFDSGNIYNYDTGTVIGDYTLSGGLPEWGKAGNFVLHPNGNWYLIEDVLYLEDKYGEVLVIDTGLSPAEDYPAIVASFYNLHNYEVYEFTIDFANYIGKRLQVSLKAVDQYFGTVEYLSEVIEVKVRHKNTVEIQYWDDENTDVYYATGIKNKMRMEVERVYGQPAGTVESYDTDTDTLLLASDIRQLDVFEFSPMTKAMMWKVDEALSHRFVTIDGVPYGEKKIEVSESLGKTNLYNVVATMKKANAQYRSGGLQFDESGMEIPALIPVGNGYVKYQ